MRLRYSRLQAAPTARNNHRQHRSIRQVSEHVLVTDDELGPADLEIRVALPVPFRKPLLRARLDCRGGVEPVIEQRGMQGSMLGSNAPIATRRANPVAEFLEDRFCRARSRRTHRRTESLIRQLVPVDQRPYQLVLGVFGNPAHAADAITHKRGDRGWLEPDNPTGRIPAS